ncbi:MAG: glycosyltransferase N-terminal domain-containing protein [Crocinitomicaceae bacterium]
MKWFYSLGVFLYTAAVKCVAWWNPKAKKWVAGRRQVWEDIAEFQPQSKVYWFHCASLGEFEQGRPIMEKLKSTEDCQLVVTFFSPSGYEVRKNYEGADLLTYLPVDTAKNAKRFIAKVQPTKAFFIKYEFWANYIEQCNKLSIPIYSVAALFRKEQFFFKWYGSYMRSVLKKFDQIFVQDQPSQDRLKEIGIQAIICGDTRFDRVIENATKVKSYPEIERFKADEKVLICGSIWQEDLQVIHQKLSREGDWKVIIAPHEISESFMAQIERKVGLATIRYSNIEQYKGEQLLIIDNIGMLMNLYQYGDLAYIGGGFKTGLHNILEPAAFGLPVIMGDKTEKFPEAKLFIENGIGFQVSNQLEFEKQFDHLKSQELRPKIRKFMESQTGATDLIIKHIS